MARRHWKSLKRRRYDAEPKSRFLLICEGKNTEPAYFQALGRANRDALLEIEIIPGAGVPFTIAELAVSRAEERGLKKNSRRKLNSFEKADEVWAIFDRDEHPRYNEAVSLCEQAGVGVGRSDPCFEVWLILHLEDYNRPDGRREAQRHFGEICEEYDARGTKIPDCDALIQTIDEAETRAEIQLTNRENEGDPYGPPSTTVGRLIGAVREAAARARR